MSRKLTRRQFLASGMAVAAGFVMAACGATPTATPVPAAAATATKPAAAATAAPATTSNAGILYLPGSMAGFDDADYNQMTRPVYPWGYEEPLVAYFTHSRLIDWGAALKVYNGVIDKRTV